MEDRLTEVATALYLGGCGDARAVEPLIRMLVDPAYECVAAAAWALGEIGDARAIAPLEEARNRDEFEVYWDSGRTFSDIGVRLISKPGFPPPHL
ncbi:HEAT repeat domain-containing protein [Methanoculleus sp.]|uniref:HEAT repeat domain-containing protein n=1 Tax=Methanoculleus sp. TaxID=90427 RepID=UPI0025FEC304|nr:HEAT repeat domain-containing protein [Methanoculleus sp.]